MTYNVEEIERLMNYLRVIKGAKNIEFIASSWGKPTTIYYKGDYYAKQDTIENFFEEMNNYYKELEKEI